VTAAGDPRPRHGALTVESIVAVDPPREYRLHPRDRVVLCTVESGGARQVAILPLRGGPARIVTASELDASDPQWSPDGRRIVFCRGDDLFIVSVDGGGLVRVDGHPAGVSHPRWSPDGRRIAFLSRRRGWSQVWIVDAPVRRRGRPPTTPRPAAQPQPVTPTGWDVEGFAWSPDGRTIAIAGQRLPDLRAHQIVLVDVVTGAETIVAGESSWDTSPSWVADGSLLHVSDADGWFQVIHRGPDGRSPVVVTAGEREHGTFGGHFGFVPLASPDGGQVVHVEVHDGLADLVVSPLAPAGPVKRPRGRPPKRPRPAEGTGRGRPIQPWDGVWRAVGWTSDGAWMVAIGESERRPQDLWMLPVPGVAPASARPRQVTASLPAVLEAGLDAAGLPPGERVAVDARDGLRIEATLWRPALATGRRGTARVPAVIRVHGGPTSQSLREWHPFKLVLAHEGFAVLDVDFRGSTGYGRAFRDANVDEWGHADVHDVIDMAAWAREQPWCDGRLAVWGGSYGGYLVLGALTEEPAMWRAGVDLYGDSEIAESYRHGDRVGRLDLERMMGSPDDPKKAPLYRRGSPVYRAERIEAPVLILHGRKDLRVVPLMTEKMVEALTIEGKHHEVHWYDDEAHGWRRRENSRDALTRTLAFLKRHVLSEEGSS
jgi:dipeptidyl aminopeptidase/acylaminoacyl peptidase